MSRFVTSVATRDGLIGDAAMGNAHVGADSTGCVRPTMDDAGRITNVDVSALWRTRLGPERVTAAVVEALGRTAGEVIAATDSFDPTAASRSGPVAEVESASQFEGLGPGRSSVAMHRLAGVIDEVLVEISQHLEQVRSASERDYIGTDDRKHVKVTLLEPGVISAVEIDEHWLGSASTERLVQALRDAIQAGYDCIEQGRAVDLYSRPATQTLRTLRNDPTALRRWLRDEES